MPFHIHTQSFCISKRALRREPSVQEELSNKISSLEEDEENIFLTLRYYAQKRSQSILKVLKIRKDGIRNKVQNLYYWSGELKQPITLSKT